MAAPVKFIGLLIDHPSARERERGVGSKVTLGVTVGQSPSMRLAPVTENQLLELIEQSAGCLRVLSEQREGR